MCLMQAFSNERPEEREIRTMVAVLQLMLKKFICEREIGGISHCISWRASWSRDSRASANQTSALVKKGVLPCAAKLGQVETHKSTENEDL